MKTGFYFIILIFSSFILIGSCTPENEKKNSDSSDNPPIEIYHADNDIAMTLRSLIDAIRVEEPLDSTDYDFEGVLTDGEGRPLYTDIQGSPGEWQVDVLSPTSVVLRNIYLGDLLPDDLQSYVEQSLALSPEDIIETDDYCDDDQTTTTVYNFQGGYLRFETRAAVAPNGLEGPLISIIISAGEYLPTQL